MQYQNTRRHRIHFETIAHEPASSIRVIRTGHGPFVFNLHYHPEIELTLIRCGHGLRFVGDSIEEFAAGDICLLGGGLLHTWESHSSSIRSEAIVLQFHREVLHPVEANWPEARGLISLLGGCAGGLRLADSDGSLAEAMEALVQAPSGSLQRMSRFLRVMELAVACRPQPLSLSSMALGAAGDAARQLNRTLQHVQAHLSEPLPLAEVAEVAGLSPTSFSRFFSRQVGKTFTRYVNEWRIRTACQKLIETDRPITDIAFSCGFENLSNFNRRFRQFKRTTPRQYRARQARY